MEEFDIDKAIDNIFKKLLGAILEAISYQDRDIAVNTFSKFVNSAAMFTEIFDSSDCEDCPLTFVAEEPESGVYN